MFTPDGTSSQTVPLDDSTLDLKFLLIWAENTISPYFKTEDMSVLRKFTNTAIVPSTTALTLGTGSFEINNNATFPEETFVDLQDQTHGSTSFPDSSGYSNTFSISSAHSGTIAWDNSTYTEGTTSIKVAGKYIEAALYQYIDFDFDFEINVKGTTTDSFQTFFIMLEPGYPAGYRLRIGHVNEYTTGTSPARVSITFGSTATIDGTTDIKDNAWHKINVVKVSGVVSLYVDSVLEGTPIASDVGFRFTGGTYNTCRIGNISSAASVLYMDRPILKFKPLVFNQQTYHYLGM